VYVLREKRLFVFNLLEIQKICPEMESVKELDKAFFMYEFIFIQWISTSGKNCCFLSFNLSSRSLYFITQKRIIETFNDCKEKFKQMVEGLPIVDIKYSYGLGIPAQGRITHSSIQS